MCEAGVICLHLYHEFSEGFDILSIRYALSSSVHLCGLGVRNITALGNLISWQKVDYDFNYHQMEFPCNINVLIMSEGRSLLPVRTAGRTSFCFCLVRLLQTLEGQQKESILSSSSGSGGWGCALREIDTHIAECFHGQL